MLRPFVFASLVCSQVAFAADEFDAAAKVIQTRCLKCHNDVDRKGGLSLTSPGDLNEFGLLDAETPESSPLLQSVTRKEGAPPAMPKNGDPLTDKELQALSAWVKSGGIWPTGRRLEDPAVEDFNWWSLEPLTRPAVPLPADADRRWVRTPIDAFIISALNERGLTHSAEADRRTLIRRVTFDLTGLPPTPDEVQKFIDDSSPLAYERLVDRLLSSPRYGERWARHWLDVVKYADTCGYDKDKLRPNAWPYRDYVIRSFNDDKPYARFVQEQIAGDVLFPGSDEGIVGLGFIAAGPWDFIGHVEVPETKIDGQVAKSLDRDDMVSNTLNTFCSVTIQCARCHNHKFDPISQAQYFGLQAVFAAVDRADRVYNVDPEVEQQRTDLANKLKKLREALDVASDSDKPDLTAGIEHLERDLANLPPQEFVYAAATQFAPQGQFTPTAGKPRIIKVLHRGNVTQPLEDALPGALPLRAGEEAAFVLDDNASEGDRRAELARWLTRDDHPLTWRSIVNRIWQYHFGRAIVDSPNDFGRMGQLPTHPELLDWLAVEFRDSGGSFKHLHRLIVTSAAYRQSSAGNEANARIDEDNRYWWRMNRRRLSAEEIRDTILTVSGRMNDQMGGPGYYLFELERPEHSPHYEYHKFNPDDPRCHRRSVYRFIVRSQPDPYMTSLDCADSSQSTPQRDETLTALQALSLLNNRFNLAFADHFARRLNSEPDTLENQINNARLLLTARPPTPEEQQMMSDYARRHGLPNLCRLLFNLSEVVYVD